MERITLQKGVLEKPQVQEVASDKLVHGLDNRAIALAANEQSSPKPLTTEAVEPLAGSTEVATESAQPRHGYREDSPPEVIARLHQAQAGNNEAFADLYRLHVDRVTRYVTNRMWDE